MGIKIQDEVTSTTTLSANALTKQLLIELPKTFKCRVWRNNRLTAKVKLGLYNGMQITRIVSAGINGQADISGVIACQCVHGCPLYVGLRLEIEIKAGKDKQSAQQIAFAKMIRTHGGIYLVARDISVIQDLANHLHERNLFSGV